MTGVRYHADQITTARALPPLERAKRNGLDVTAGVSIHHLTLNEFDVGDYRTFFKVKPPLRVEDDRVAVVEAVASGPDRHHLVDAHAAGRGVEAPAVRGGRGGAVALETLPARGAAPVPFGRADLPQLFRAMSLNPAKRLGLPGGRLAEGAPADLVLFDPDAPFVLDRFALRSKSKNTPFDGARMQGRVAVTLVGGRDRSCYGSGDRMPEIATRAGCCCCWRRCWPTCWARSPSAW